MFANKLQIKQTINTCRMLGRLNNICMVRMEALAVLLLSRTYKPLTGNWLLKLQSYSERSQNVGLPPKSYHLSASAILSYWVSSTRTIGQ